MKKFFLFAFLIYLITVPVFAKNTILILGDSLSAGYGLQLNESWVSLLKNRLQSNNYDYDVVNISVSGNTTSNGLMALAPALKQYHPHIVIVELGGNDGLRGLQITQIKNNLQTIITNAKAAGSEVLLVGLRLPPNYGQLYTEQFAALFVDLAKENEIALVPLFLKGVDDHPDLMSPDQIHPLAKAQVILLDNIWPELQKIILLKKSK